MPSVILFDFDGTVADSMDAVMRIGNRLAPKFGTPIVTAEKVERWKQLHLREVLNEAEVAWWKLPCLLRRMRRELHHEVQTIDPVPGMPAVLRSLQQSGFRLGILTSNAKGNVEAFLHHHNLEDCFDMACTQASLFGKRRMLKRCLKRYGLSAAETVYVGDETRDIAAARACGVKAIAVEWGFNSRSALLTVQPDAVATQPTDLLTLLMSKSLLRGSSCGATQSGYKSAQLAQSKTC